MVCFFIKRIFLLIIMIGFPVVCLGSFPNFRKKKKHINTQLAVKQFKVFQSMDEFDVSMDFTDASNKEQRLLKMNDPIIQLCKDLYFKNKLSSLDEKKDPIIPKRVHLIWVGPKTPPPIFNECLESIKKHLPTWECKVWRDEDVENLNLSNQKFYDEEKNYGAKSDILRYELLYNFGGLYLDIDMVVQKPLDILHHTYEFYVGLHPSSLPDIIGNAVIASVPGHPILKKCIESIKFHRNQESILHRTGPIFFQQIFFDLVIQNKFPRVIAFPASYFFPLDPYKDFGKKKKEFVKTETFTVHYWANSWLPDDNHVWDLTKLW